MSQKKLWILGVLISSNVLAQNLPKTDKVLEEVVVTANKIEQKQSSTGKVITLINKATIEKNLGKSIAQLLNEQAGVIVNGSLNNTGAVQTVYMRGAAAGRTLILLDGIPLNDPSTITTDFDLNLLSLNDVESIEVCKGAQSTLYGSDAIAGVINILTTKKNPLKPLQVKLTQSIGNLRTSKTNLQVFGKKNKWQYTVRYANLSTNGFSAANDSLGKNNYDNDGYLGNMGSAQVQLAASKQLTIKSYLLYSQYQSSIDAGVFTDEKDYRIHNNSTQSGIQLDWQLGNLKMKANYHYGLLNRRYLNDSSYRSNTIFEDNSYRGASHFLELYASTKLTNKIQLVAGADFREGDYSQDYFSLSGFGPYHFSVARKTVTQKSIYATAMYHSKNENLHIELGSRLNQHEVYGNHPTITFNPSYAINQHWQFFGSISTGFKAPSLYQLSLNQQLAAEKAFSTELGIRYQQEKFNTRLVYFNRNTRNGIEYNYISYNYFNYLKQAVKGLEIEAQLSPSEKLKITGNYSLLNSKETTQNRLTNKDTLTYFYLLRRPKHSANITISYQFTQQLSASVATQYRSKRMDIGGYKKMDRELAGYLMVDAQVHYEFNQKFRAFMDARNIGNKTFFDVRGFNSIPFLINLGIAFNW